MQQRSTPFVPDVDAFLPGAASGPLAGMTFAAKDLFDVRGTVTGCGNPDWARTHPPAERSAWTVERLLAAGATLAGKTITDEISLGLLGINRFHGTPLNPVAPDRVPGGSSSGSASAVAAGLVHTALGTDLHRGIDWLAAGQLAACSARGYSGRAVPDRLARVGYRAVGAGKRRRPDRVAGGDGGCRGMTELQPGSRNATHGGGDDREGERQCHSHTTARR